MQQNRIRQRREQRKMKRSRGNLRETVISNPTELRIVASSPDVSRIHSLNQTVAESSPGVRRSNPLNLLVGDTWPRASALPVKSYDVRPTEKETNSEGRHSIISPDFFQKQ